MPSLWSRITNSVTTRIAVYTTFNFLCYLVIGMQLAVLPVFVHMHMGFSPLIAGVVVSMEYVATLVTRHHAGKMSDSSGAKSSVLLGQMVTIASGAMLIVATMSAHHRALALTVLLVARLLLGAGESLVGVGATLWGIGRVGAEHTAQVMSYGGVAGYSAIAAGAPLGVWIENRYGLTTLAVVMTAIPVAGFFLAEALAAVPVTGGKSMEFFSVLGRVYKQGLGLALGTVGFGSIASFATLYYVSHCWPDAAFSLTVFGLCFVFARASLARSLDRRNGYRVAAVSLTVETIGLLLLWHAQTSHQATFAAAIVGAGFALVFPSLGIESVRNVDMANRGTAIGVYTAFLDLSLGVTGPVAGLIVIHFGYSEIFLFAAAATAVALALSLSMLRTSHVNRAVPAAD